MDPASIGAEKALSGMDLAHKVGQMIVAGWTGTTVTPELRGLISERRVGGVSLLPRNLMNAGQTVALTHEMQQLATEAGHPAPLWLSADQEGGAILAVRDGITPFPGAMALGACAQPELAYRVGRAIAVELAALGINLNYAPVLDVNSNPENPIIGVRSFGGDPELVASLGLAFAQGTMDAGVLPVGKHFPGHGDTEVDSHLALPVVRRTFAEAERRELAPFRAAATFGIPAIMTSHVVFPSLDPEYPATLSSAVLTGLLRHKLGFTGLILTDCLEMEAIAAHWPVEVFAVLAVKAGADMLLVSHSLERQLLAIDAVVQAVRSGEIHEERIDQSVRRILVSKRRWIRPTTGRLPETWTEILESHRALETEVAAGAVTLVRNDGLLPLDPSSTQIIVIWPQVAPRARTTDPSEICPLGRVIAEACAEACAEVKAVQFSPVPDESEIARVVETVGAAVDHRADEADRAAGGAGTVLVIGTATSRPIEWQAQGRLVQQLLGLGPPAVVAALRSPYDLRQFPECRNYLACYSYHPAAVRALVDVLFGRRKPTGVAPVSIVTGGGT